MPTIHPGLVEWHPAEGVHATINPVASSRADDASMDKTRAAAPTGGDVRSTLSTIATGVMLVLLLLNVVFTLDVRASLRDAQDARAEGGTGDASLSLLQRVGVVHITRDEGVKGTGHDHVLVQAPGFNGFPREYPRGDCDPKADTGNATSVFQLGATLINGTYMDFRALQGKVVLVVNVASY